jgi:hypothetical protein
VHARCGSIDENSIRYHAEWALLLQFLNSGIFSRRRTQFKKLPPWPGYSSVNASTACRGWAFGGSNKPLASRSFLAQSGWRLTSYATCGKYGHQQ